MNNEERLKISNSKLNALENILPDYIKIISDNLTNRLNGFKLLCKKCNAEKDVQNSYDIPMLFQRINNFENELNNLIENY